MLTSNILELDTPYFDSKPGVPEPLLPFFSERRQHCIAVSKDYTQILLQGGLVEYGKGGQMGVDGIITDYPDLF